MTPEQEKLVDEATTAAWDYLDQIDDDEIFVDGNNEAIASAERSLRSALEALHMGRVPAALAALPQWHVCARDGRKPWWGRVGDTGRAFACDGSSLLILDACPAAPETPSDRWPSSEYAAGMIRKISTPHSEASLFVVERAEIVDSGPRYVQIGETIFERQRLVRWVVSAWNAAGLESIVVGPTTFDPGHFRGPGWHAIVMPCNGAALDEIALPIGRRA